MGQVDALSMVAHLRRRLVDLAVSENHIRDSKLSQVSRRVWQGPSEDGGLVSEIWVEGAFPPRLSNDSLKTLSDEGLFPADLCRHLDDCDAFPADRLLYDHQSESLRKAVAAEVVQPTLAITAGTGHGKTEAFLLPMLANLWSAPERQKNGGMRCLILYPMNALVSDQVDRIYRWLKGQSRITVFHFTSETPEDANRANNRGEPAWENCRMRTREEARGRESHEGRRLHAEPFGNVPDIVITNYSMLEYMLCRPQDACFFGPDLRCIILDEAHLYTGTLAVEIMMLLRRVRERCGVSPSSILHIATSATLGGDDENLRVFGSSLFSTDRSNTIVIRGQYGDNALGKEECAPLARATALEVSQYANFDIQTLTPESGLIDDNPETVSNLREFANRLVSCATVDQAEKKHPTSPACFLEETMKRAPLIRQMAEILGADKGNALSLNDLADTLFPGELGNEKRNATIALLRLAAVARKRSQDLPLVPHRLHFLFRAPAGLSVCLNPECSGPDVHRIESAGCLQPLGDHCRHCQHVLLPICRCQNCDDWALAAHTNQESSALEPGYHASPRERQTYYLLVRTEDLDLQEVVVDSQNGEIRGHGAPGVSLWEAPRKADDPRFQRCPTCKSSWEPVYDVDILDRRNTCQSLVGGRRYALSVTAETILSDLPPDRSVSRNWKPAEGRRLLCFSDSRAGAARLGPLLTQQHEMQVIRAAMARCVNKLHPYAIVEVLNEEIGNLKLRLSNGGMPDLHRTYFEEELEKKKEQLRQAEGGTPFSNYASLVGQQEELLQILDRETAETHRADNFGQSDWEKNGQKVRRHIEGIVAKELGQLLKRRVSVESVGLLEIVYPGIEKLSVPPVVEEKLPRQVRHKIADVWPEIVAMLLDDTRRNGCVEWSEFTQSRKWLDENPLTGRWLTRTRRGWNATAFVGATPRQLRRAFVADVLLAAGCVEKDMDILSEQILCGVFDQLFESAGNGLMRFGWLEREGNHQTGIEEADKAIRILLDRLSVRVPIQLFRCEASGTIWTRTVLGWAPVEGCLGTLRVISSDQLDSDARWGRARREFKESSIFNQGLWAEEHSAQLSPHENRRLQDLFKLGIRNILSSTTTMELGIDIGGLNGVLLGNVPPGPANHRQRAGRAGRRSDGSAVVVTYARDSEFDREVFRLFGDFLNRELRKPTIFVNRQRIITRHLHAVLLSEFLRSKQPLRTGAMHAYGRMGAFCGEDEFPDYWKRDSQSKPAWPPPGNGITGQFRDFLNELKTMDGEIRSRLCLLARHTGVKTDDVDTWRDFVSSAVRVFERAVSEWEKEITQLREAWDEIPSSPQSVVSREVAKANSIRHMVKSLCQITVIEWLADRRFLPRYGFPINVQRLTVRRGVDEGYRDSSKPDERYGLERSSLLALREYVPGSRILVGGRIATSQGVRKHWTDSNLNEALGLQYFSLECPEEHIYVRQSPNELCPRCNLPPLKKRQLVFPRFGYTTAGWENMPLGTNVERIGIQSICPTAFTEETEGEKTENFAGVAGARVVYREEASLLVRNHGKHHRGFAICTRCGFAMSEDEFGQGKIDLPASFASHASIFSSNVHSFCWEKRIKSAPVLRNRVLAARELTDMVLLEWPNAHSRMRDGVYSLGHALLLAGAQCLEIDQRELGMELVPLREGNLGIVIYDTSPGGAGHCQELIHMGRDWITTTRRILFVDEKHHLRCRRACLDCILDFSGQHSASRLNRISALVLLDNV